MYYLVCIKSKCLFKKRKRRGSTRSCRRPLSEPFEHHTEYRDRERVIQRNWMNPFSRDFNVNIHLNIKVTTTTNKHSTAFERDFRSIHSIPPNASKLKLQTRTSRAAAINDDDNLYLYMWWYGKDWWRSEPCDAHICWKISFVICCKQFQWYCKSRWGWLATYQLREY